MTAAAWQATVLTLFPEMFPGPLGLSLAGKALEGGLWTLKALDIREHARDCQCSSRAVADAAQADFGGGQRLQSNQ